MSIKKTNNKNSIRHWSDEDKPREKLLALGLHHMSDAELLAIILGSGNRDKSAVDLAREILAQSDNNLAEIESLDIQDLLKFRGVGDAKAVSIKAALELGRRSQLAKPEKRPILHASHLVYEVVSRDLGRQPHEECWALFLNQRNELISKERMSSGGITATVVDVRLILKRAIEKFATGIILCHNHPSGNLKPSQSDRDITAKLSKACSYLDLKLLDHLIVTKSGYYSFSDEGEVI